MIHIIQCPTKQECDLKTVEIINSSVQKILQTQSSVTVAIPGGRSVAGIFEELIHADIEWTRVHIFMVDERLVDLDNPESNYRLAREIFIGELMEKGLLPQENVHPFIIEKGIASYQQELKQLAGKFDILLVSSGEDGHIAGLFPYHHSIDDPSSYFITMDDAPKPPAQRMSASASLITKAQVAIILFYGEGKREAYQKFKDKNTTIKESPNKLVLKVPECYVVTDLKAKL